MATPSGAGTTGWWQCIWGMGGCREEVHGADAPLCRRESSEDRAVLARQHDVQGHVQGGRDRVKDKPPRPPELQTQKSNQLWQLLLQLNTLQYYSARLFYTNGDARIGRARSGAVDVDDPVLDELADDEARDEGRLRVFSAQAALL